MSPGPERAISLLQEALGAKYEVLRWIGGGGMAQVYLARNRVTGGLFAIKVLAEHLAQDENIVRRFLDEARTAATLSGHANVVSIFDVGDYGTLHYLVMQFIDGVDLSALLKQRRKFPPAEARRIVEQIAEALVWSAAKHVVHRDLKPSNVRIDKTGRAVVLDFGIAKAGDVPSGLTAAGDRLGTPYYMSPEHFREGVCDHRSDLYALGIIFFELMTGERPFEGDTVRAVEAAHLFTPPRSVLEIDPGIPPEYARVISRLLEKRPADRYQTASELLNDLRGGTPAQPAEIPAGPEPACEAPPAAAPAPKRMAMYAAAACVLVGALALGFFLLRRAQGGAAAGAERSIQTPSGEMLLVDASPAFYIDATEVSNSAYKAFCDQTGAPYPAAPAWDPNYFFSHPDYPVVNVTWRDAAAYAKWAGKRLPSEAEWESAALGTDGRRYPWGNEPPDASRCRGGHAPAAKSPAAVSELGGGASPAGARNMSGNVWEWTSTVYTPSGAELLAMRASVKAEASAGEWRAIKGGCFEETDPGKVAGKSRSGYPVSARPSKVPIGFRCARDIQ